MQKSKCQSTLSFSRRRFLTATGGLVGVSALAACGLSEQAAAPEATPADTTTAAGTTTPSETPATSGAETYQVPGFLPFATALPMMEVIEDQGETIVVSHLYGETEIPKDPQRVWADTSALPVAVFLGLNVVGGYNLAGRATPPNWEAATAGMEIREGSTNVDYEWVLSLNPDLILTAHTVIFSSGDPQDTYDTLSQIAPTVVFSDDSLAYWQEAATDLAEVFALNEEATARLNNVDAEIAEACEPLRETIGDDSVLRLSIFNDQLWVIGPGYMQDDRFIPVSVASHIYKFCGLTPFANLDEIVGDNGSVSISTELVPELQADYIFVSATGDTGAKTLEDLGNNPLWQTIPAVQKEQVYLVDYITADSYDLTLMAIDSLVEAMALDAR